MTNEIITTITNHEELFKKFPDLQFSTLKDILIASDREALDYFLDKGFDINCRNDLLENIAFYLNQTEFSFAVTLVDKGLDLHAINMYGETILQHISYRSSEELIKFVLSQGVDPYQLSFNGESILTVAEEHATFHDFRDGISASFIIENSITDANSYISFKDAFKERNFPLMLTIVEKELKGLGGISTLFSQPRLEQYKFIQRLYSTLLLNKKYVDANVLMKAHFTVETSYAGMPARMKALGLESILLTKDISNMENYYAFFLKKLEDTALHMFEFNTFCSVNELDSPDYLFDNLKSRGNMQIEVALDYVWHYFDLAIDTSTTDKIELLRDLEMAAFDTTIELNKMLLRLQLLGFYHLYKKDLVQSEYFFNEIIRQSELHNVFSNEYAGAYAMIDYIQQKREW